MTHRQHTDTGGLTVIQGWANPRVTVPEMTARC